MLVEIARYIDRQIEIDRLCASAHGHESACSPAAGTRICSVSQKKTDRQLSKVLLHCAVAGMARTVITKHPQTVYLVAHRGQRACRCYAFLLCACWYHARRANSMPQQSSLLVAFEQLQLDPKFRTFAEEGMFFETIRIFFAMQKIS